MSDLSKKTILLVEDEAIISLSTSKIIKNYSYNVIISLKGEKAVQEVKNNPAIDLVLMDINLGRGIDGVEAARQILLIKELPIIFLTSHSDQNIVDKVKSITRYGYVIKNSGEFVLMESIAMAFELFEVNKKLKNDIEVITKAEAELKKSETKFSGIFNTSPLGICINEQGSGIFTEINDAFTKITGYKKEEVIGKDTYKLNVLFDDAIVKNCESMMMKNGKITNYEVKYKKRNGETGYGLISSEFIDFEGRKCVITIVNDITEKKNIEKEKELLFSLVPDMIFRMNNEHEILDYHCNDESQLYLEPEKFINKKVGAVLPAEAAEKITMYANTAFKTHTMQQFEFMLSISGEKRIYEDRLIPVNGNYAYSIVRDITRSKLIEKTLSERDNVLTSVTEFTRRMLNKGINSDNLNYILEELGKGFNLSRTYIFKQENENDNTVNLKQIYEWCANGIFSSTDVIDAHNFEVKKNSEFGRKIENLKSKGCIYSYIECTDDSLEKHLMDIQLINSYLFISIYINNKWWGFIGFDECKLNRKWQEYEIGVLTTAANIIGGWLQNDESQKQLEESRMHYYTLINNSPDSVTVSNLEGKIIFTSQMAHELFGFGKEDDLSGMDIFSFVAPESRVKALEKFIKVAQKGGYESNIFTLLRNDGSKFEAEVNASRYSDANGKPEGIIIVCRDITEKLATEKKLEEELVRRRILIDGSRDGIVVLDGNGKVFDANKKFADMLGYSSDEINNMFVWDWDKNLPKEKIIELINSVDVGGHQFETVHTKKDGSVIDVELSNNGAEINGEKLIFCVCRDVTKRNMIQKQIKISEEKFSKIFRQSPVGISIIKVSDMTYVDVNEALIKMSGFSMNEIIGKTPFELGFYTKETNDVILKNKKYNKGENNEHIFIRRDGKLINVLVNRENIVIAGEEHYLNTVIDITSKKADEKKIRESESKFSKIFHSSPVGIAITSASTGEFIDVNRTLLELSGIDKDVLLKMKTLDALNISAEKRAELIDSIMSNEKVTYAELDYQKPGGEIYKGAFFFDKFELEGERYILTTVFDMTDKKEQELRIKKSLKEKEILLKELQHRVKNNLSLISGLLNIEMGNLKDERTIGIFRNSITRVNSLSAIYEQLYSSDDLENIDIADYLNRLITSIRDTYSYNENTDIKTYIEEDSRLDLKRSVTLGLMFNELLTNALKYAAKDNGRCIIEAGYRVEDGTAVMNVKDNGKGLPANFDIDKSSSMGLKLVKMMTEQLEGSLNINRDCGTNVKIRFKI